MATDRDLENGATVQVFLRRWADVLDGVDAGASLNAAEQARAARFMVAGARGRYLAGRVLTRRVLGDILKCDPADVPIVVAESGKPKLDTADGPQFNLSHSGDYVALALSARPVGVDIEKITERVTYTALADRFLSETDQALVRNSAVPLNDFFRIWTRIETYLKGLGDGLTLDTCEVQAGLEGPIRHPDRQVWHGLAFTTPDGYAGSVAAMEEGFSLEML